MSSEWRSVVCSSWARTTAVLAFKSYIITLFDVIIVIVVEYIIICLFCRPVFRQLPKKWRTNPCSAHRWSTTKESLVQHRLLTQKHKQVKFTLKLFKSSNKTFFFLMMEWLSNISRSVLYPCLYHWNSVFAKVFRFLKSISQYLITVYQEMSIYSNTYTKHLFLLFIKCKNSRNTHSLFPELRAFVFVFFFCYVKTTLHPKL